MIQLILNLLRLYKIPDEISLIIIYKYKSIIHPISNMIKNNKKELIIRYYNLDIPENRYKLEIFISNYKDINDFIIDNDTLLYFWKLDRSFDIITERKCDNCNIQIYNKYNKYKIIDLLRKKKTIPGFSYTNYEKNTNYNILCDRCIEYKALDSINVNKSRGNGRFIIRGYKSLGYKSLGILKK